MLAMRGSPSRLVGPRSFTLAADENDVVCRLYPRLRNPVLLANRTLAQAKATFTTSPDLHAFFNSQRTNQSFLATPATYSFSQIRVQGAWPRALFCPTSKMSHAGSWRAACLNRNWIQILNFGALSAARGVTDPGVGSGALFGVCRHSASSSSTLIRIARLP